MKPLGIKFEVVKKFIGDLIFPKNCLGCKKEGEWLCDDCRLKIKTLKKIYCPVCQKPQITVKVCPACQAGSFLSGLWVLADYENELIKKMIHLLKYNFVTELAGYFDRLVFDYFQSGREWQKDFVLLPVPLAKKRFLSRGFNQAELIAQAVKRVLGNKIEPNVLKRVKFKKPQARLGARARLKNIKDNFVLNKNFNLSVKDVVLVDDVYTTGATMQECARVLKEKIGDINIWGLVVAKPGEEAGV